jgi:DNA-directed RNA polymerase specialized sigma24 family protein
MRRGPQHSRDLTDEVALVTCAERDRLLAVHRLRLRREDLEDCYSQATLELVAQARRGALRCSGRAHLRNILEQRFVSRICDHQRALSGRSPRRAILERALPLGAPGERELEIADASVDVELRVMMRFELRSLAHAARSLSADQRLVLASQIGVPMGRGEFCRRSGWSHEKYRKVAQRGRARLRRALSESPADDFCT